MQQLKEYIINDTNSTVLVDELMKKHTTYGIGGPAEMFVLPSNKEDLIRVFEISREANQEINVIGSGSNLLVSDNGIKGVVICIKDCLKNLEVFQFPYQVLDKYPGFLQRILQNYGQYSLLMNNLLSKYR